MLVQVLALSIRIVPSPNKLLDQRNLSWTGTETQPRCQSTFVSISPSYWTKRPPSPFALDAEQYATLQAALETNLGSGRALIPAATVFSYSLISACISGRTGTGRPTVVESEKCRLDLGEAARFSLLSPADNPQLSGPFRQLSPADKQLSGPFRQLSPADNPQLSGSVQAC